MAAYIESLKTFVHTDLNLRGKWSSSGGEVKLFKNSEVSLKWCAKIKKLVIVRDEAKRSLKNKLKYLSSIVYETEKHRSNQVVEEI